jgi:Ethanolamine ammonia-lyase, large subunit
MKLSCKLNGKFYTFKSLKEVMGKANEKKSGDALAGLSASSGEERVAAKLVLSSLTVRDIRENPAVPYEEDEVTRIIQDDLDPAVYSKYAGMEIGELREFILKSDGKELLSASKGLTSEAIAAVSKIMGNLDLIYAAKKIETTATCNTTIGKSGVFASRLQPNHPTDSVKGVRASVFDGLSYGVGDAVIGLNPAIDTVEDTAAVLNALNDIKEKYKIPTQICVLSHVTTQMKAIAGGAPSDLIFQSIAGTEGALRSFGTDARMLEEANAVIKEYGTAKGPNLLYFETGQGSALSSGFHYGNDQQTLEARCYGLARHYKPFLVNTVVGFIGPEYLYDGRQVLRAALEDNFCGKLHGLPMGCDCCYTNHMDADQNDVENLLVLMAAAGSNYVMGLPQGDDVMLMYESTGYHDIAAVRETLGLRPIREFEKWLEERGIWENGRLTERAGDLTIF